MKGRVGITLMFSFFVFWIFLPVMNHNKATSRDVKVSVLAEPFLESPRLIYRWTGDVYRSCPIEIRRSIIDSQGVVTHLVGQSFGRLPVGDLGDQSYEVSVDVPAQIAEGPAAYLAFEVPACDWMQRLFPVVHAYPPVEFTVTR